MVDPKTIICTRDNSSPQKTNYTILYTTKPLSNLDYWRLTRLTFTGTGHMQTIVCN